MGEVSKFLQSLKYGRSAYVVLLPLLKERLRDMILLLPDLLLLMSSSGSLHSSVWDILLLSTLTRFGYIIIGLFVFLKLDGRSSYDSIKL